MFDTSETILLTTVGFCILVPVVMFYAGYGIWKGLSERIDHLERVVKSLTEVGRADGSALRPSATHPGLTERDVAVLTRLGRDIDEAIRSNAPGSKLVYVWRDGMELKTPVVQALERRYVEAGWSKLSIVPTAGGTHVVTLIP